MRNRLNCCYMKKIKLLFLVFASFYLNQAQAEDVKTVNVVCANEQCFKKIEDAYANVKCYLKIISSNIVHFERSFPINESIFRVYELHDGCIQPLSKKIKMHDFACKNGYYKLRDVQVENQSTPVCIRIATPGSIKPLIRSLREEGVY